MKNSTLTEILKDGNLVIPIYIFKKYKDLKLELDEFIFLMYLYNKGNEIVFDPNKFSKDLGVDLGTVMTYISTLTDKGYVKVDVVKREKGLIEEVVKLDDFFNKMSILVVEDINKVDNTKSDIFEIIEKEFGRTLSPIEFEIIKAWLDSNISEELIKEALKEATYNGVSNLRYIDKILYEWGKKGIKTKEDVEKQKLARRKEKESEKDIDMDLIEWDWFDEDE